jgi:hypothetical protein
VSSGCFGTAFKSENLLRISRYICTQINGESVKSPFLLTKPTYSRLYLNGINVKVVFYQLDTKSSIIDRLTD